MTKQERVEFYKEFLAEEGYRPKIDEEGEVVFKYEGLDFSLDVDEDDDEFFSVYTCIHYIENEKEREKVFEAANEATTTIKVAKVCVIDSCVVAKVEQFVSTPELVKTNFGRYMSALSVSVNMFFEKIQEVTVTEEKQV